MGLFDFLFKRKTDDEIELEDTLPNVISLLSHGRKLEAIKFVKDSTGVSLKKAKDFVEKYEGKANTAEAHLQNQFKNNDVPEAMANQARELVNQGRKMEAIKLIKDSTNLGLKECKDFVEKL